MRDEHLGHPWHIFVKVIHILDLHDLEESVRLREVRGAAEPVRWGEHRRGLIR